MRFLYGAFLVAMLGSLIGNACADFALIWHGLFSGAGEGRWFGNLSAFYVGQAVGFVLLAPFVSAIFERTPKRLACIGLELIYSVILCLVWVLFRRDWLNAPAIFFAAIALSALSAVYRAGVIFSVLKVVSEKLHMPSVVSNYFIIFNLTVIFGALLSGVIFRAIGFGGCLLLAVVTFLPMPILYFKLFGKDVSNHQTLRPGILTEVAEGLKAFYANRVLFHCGLSIGILNVSATVFPVIVGAAFFSKYPGRSDIVGASVAIGMSAATCLIPVFQKYARTFYAHSFILISVLPLLGVLLICFATLNPVFYVLAFALACCGITLTNIITGQLRVGLVSKDLTSRVNTGYFSLLSIGQVIGALLVVPLLKDALPLATAITFVAYLAGGILALFLLPRVRIGALLQGAYAS